MEGEEGDSNNNGMPQEPLSSIRSLNTAYRIGKSVRKPPPPRNASLFGQLPPGARFVPRGSVSISGKRKISHFIPYKDAIMGNKGNTKIPVYLVSAHGSIGRGAPSFKLPDSTFLFFGATPGEEYCVWGPINDKMLIQQHREGDNLRKAVLVDSVSEIPGNVSNPATINHDNLLDRFIRVGKYKKGDVEVPNVECTFHENPSVTNRLGVFNLDQEGLAYEQLVIRNSILPEAEALSKTDWALQEIIDRTYEITGIPRGIFILTICGGSSIRSETRENAMGKPELGAAASLVHIAKTQFSTVNPTLPIREIQAIDSSLIPYSLKIRPKDPTALLTRNSLFQYGRLGTRLENLVPLEQQGHPYWREEIHDVGQMKTTSPLLAALLRGNVTSVEKLINRATINKARIDGLTPIYLASLKGYTEVVKLLLDNHADVNVKLSTNGNTPLFIASENNHTAIVNLLLKIRGIDVNSKNKSDETPLFIASKKGHLDIVKELLIHGASKEDSNDGNTPLMTAMENGHLGVVEMLLIWGAAVNTVGNYGATPLLVASKKGQLEIVRRLLVRGATVNTAMNDGATPLLIASENGHLEIVRELLAWGAAVDAARHDGATPLLIASQEGHSGVMRELLARGAKASFDPMLLLIASNKGQLEVVRELLDRGAAVNAANTDGSTPLLVASRQGHLAVVKMLLDRGAAVEAAENDGVTPLYVASQEDRLEVVHELLARGAAVDAKRNNGTTPLYAASKDGHAKVVHALLGHGAAVDAADNDGWTPLHMAISNQHWNIVGQLLLRGANVNAVTKDDGRTPLHFSCFHGYVDVVRELLDRGAAIDARRDNGATPLFVASLMGHLWVVKLLLQRGANVNIPMKDDHTPLDVAQQKGHTKIIEELLKAGATTSTPMNAGAAKRRTYKRRRTRAGSTKKRRKYTGK